MNVGHQRRTNSTIFFIILYSCMSRHTFSFHVIDLIESLKIWTNFDKRTEYDL